MNEVLSAIWWLLWRWLLLSLGVAVVWTLGCYAVDAWYARRARRRLRQYDASEYQRGFRAGVGRVRLLEDIATEKTGTGRMP